MKISTSKGNKRIAINSLVLYLRMIVVTIISLYTSRVILKTLGVSDFGIYNIVGGIVAALSVITSLSSSTQRYINFNLGKNDIEGVYRITNKSIVIHLTIIILFFFIGETFGYWVLFKNLNIPQDRVYAAMVVYHLSLLTMCANVMRSPYLAVVIAYEKMNFFAYCSIFESVAKLIIAISISFISIDKLISYSILLLFVGVLLLLISYLYVKKILKHYRFKINQWDNEYKEFLLFSGWSMMTNVTIVLSWQGLNYIFNIFGGVILNASMGATNQVTNAVSGLISNFQTAFKPQLMQRYSSCDKSLKDLVVKASKFSFLLFYVCSLPLIIYIDKVLKLWIGFIPIYSDSFICLLLIYLMIDAISYPLLSTIEASGKIRTYQIINLLVNITVLIITYILLKIGLNPTYAILLKTLGNIIIYIARYYISSKRMDISLSYYYTMTIRPCLYVIIMTSPLYLFTKFTKINWIISAILIMFISTLVVCLFGITKEERNGIIKTIISQKDK